MDSETQAKLQQLDTRITGLPTQGTDMNEYNEIIRRRREIYDMQARTMKDISDYSKNKFNDIKSRIDSLNSLIDRYNNVRS